MPAERDYTDQAIQATCRDQSTGFHGQLLVQDDELRLALFCFHDGALFRGDHLIVEHAQQRAVQMDSGNYATLFDCIEAGHGATGGKADFSFFEQRIIPNMVFLGTRVWRPEDRVRSIRFKFVGGETALYYSEHSRRRFKAFSEGTGDAVHTHAIDYSRLDILSARAGGIEIRLWMSVSASFGIDPGTRSTPVVRIELEESAPIHMALSIAHEVLVFFEMSLGVRARMREIYVSPLTNQEQMALIKTGERFEDFRVRLLFGDWEPSTARTHPGAVVFPVYSSSDRDVTKAALSSWVERRQDWKRAYDLASAYLRAPDSYDRDRLLRLFAWFEAIPLYQVQTGISASLITKLASAANEKAQELSIPVNKGRLREVLGELKRRPLKERMTSAVDRVRARFNDIAIPESTDQDCLEAVRLRNLAAHGRMTPDDHDFTSFVRAIGAVQMVCFLSMLLDLDLGGVPTQLRLSSQHPLMMYKLLEHRK